MADGYEKTAAVWKADYEAACRTIAAMHAAAVGEVTGPQKGVVEDVANLRAKYVRQAVTIARYQSELQRVRELLVRALNPTVPIEEEPLIG